MASVRRNVRYDDEDNDDIGQPRGGAVSGNVQGFVLRAALEF
jgi:hypothetical protein